MSTDLAAEVSRKTEELREAEALLLSRRAEVDAAKQEIDRIAALETVTVKDITASENAKRSLPRLETQVADAEAEAKKAQAALATVNVDVKRARLAELRDRVAADDAAMLKVAQEANALFGERQRAHRALIFDARAIEQELGEPSATVSAFSRADGDNALTRAGNALLVERRDEAAAAAEAELEAERAKKRAFDAEQEVRFRSIPRGAFV